MMGEGFIQSLLENLADEKSLANDIENLVNANTRAYDEAIKLLQESQSLNIAKIGVKIA